MWFDKFEEFCEAKSARSANQIYKWKGSDLLLQTATSLNITSKNTLVKMTISPSSFIFRGYL